MILGKWPTWRTILFYVFVYIFNCLHVPSTSCSSSGKTNCVNTTSGSCRWPCRVQVGIKTLELHTIQWQLPDVVLTQFVSPDDENDVLETCRVKNINKYIEKNCASRWSFSKKGRSNCFTPGKETPVNVTYCERGWLSPKTCCDALKGWKKRVALTGYRTKIFVVFPVTNKSEKIRKTVWGKCDMRHFSHWHLHPIYLNPVGSTPSNF